MPHSSPSLPHSSPVRARYGVSFVIIISDLYSASISVILCIISCHIWPGYDGTRLYNCQMATREAVSSLRCWSWCHDIETLTGPLWGESIHWSLDNMCKIPSRWLLYQVWSFLFCSIGFKVKRRFQKQWPEIITLQWNHQSFMQMMIYINHLCKWWYTVKFDKWWGCIMSTSKQ